MDKKHETIRQTLSGDIAENWKKWKQRWTLLDTLKAKFSVF